MSVQNCAIVYYSKHGATKQYADWLSEDLQCDLIKVNDFKPALAQKYDILVFCSGVYAGKLTIAETVKKYYSDIKDKKVVVFAVGVMPYKEELIEDLLRANLNFARGKIPFFFCRGEWNRSTWSIGDQIFYNTLWNKKNKQTMFSTSKDLVAFFDYINTSEDRNFIDRKYLDPIIAHIKSL